MLGIAPPSGCEPSASVVLLPCFGQARLDYGRCPAVQPTSQIPQARAEGNGHAFLIWAIVAARGATIPPDGAARLGCVCRPTSVSRDCEGKSDRFALWNDARASAPLRNA